MTLPSSGSLSYNSIRAEFGSPSSNVYLSLYYRGGPYTYNIPQNSNITTGSSSSIAVNDFYGSSGKGPFLQFSGGSHNTGGKAPTLYYGAGGPSLPGMGDSSITIGGTGYTVTRFYHANTSMFITGTPNSNIASAPTWSQRNFYGYNSSGSLAFQFRTGWPAGRGPQPVGIPIGQAQNTQPRTGNYSPGTWVYESHGTYPTGSLSFGSDSYMASPSAIGGSGQPGPSFISGSASALGQYIVVKAN